MEQWEWVDKASTATQDPEQEEGPSSHKQATETRSEEEASSMGRAN